MTGARIVPLAPLLDVMRRWSEKTPIRWCGTAESMLMRSFDVRFVWRVRGCGCKNCLQLIDRGDVPRFTPTQDSVTEVDAVAVMRLLESDFVQDELESDYARFRAEILAVMP